MACARSSSTSRAVVPKGTTSAALYSARLGCATPPTVYTVAASQALAAVMMRASSAAVRLLRLPNCACVRMCRARMAGFSLHTVVPLRGS